MRFLIVGVSLLFAFIFYIFYTANLGKNIFLQSSEYVFYGKTLLWSFMYLPILFLCLAVFFFFIFKSKNNQILTHIDEEEFEDEELGPVQDNFSRNISFYVFIIFLLSIIFYLFEYNFVYLLMWLTACIFVHFWVNYLYFQHKINSIVYVQWNIFSIIFGYGFSLLSIFFVEFHKSFQGFDLIDQQLLYIWILLVAGFHIYIHLRYGNIISLFLWIITIIYSLYRIISGLIPWIF